MTLKPSSLFSYALRALVDLSIHQVSGQVKVASIAKRQGIPPRCLEQIFNRLRRKGLVIAERGPRGGYRLARHPGQIQISDVFQSLATEKRVIHAIGPADPAAGLWSQVQAAVYATLKATTLESLAAQAHQQNLLPLDHHFTFHI